MRDVADADGVREFMRAFGRAAHEPASVYLTGGATAVLFGWRPTTIDVDLRLEPDRDELFRAIAALKERLRLNIELASPLDFIPAATDWRARSTFIEKLGPLSFHHFDLYAQALAKTERHHEQDVADVTAMLERGLIDPQRMIRYFEGVASRLYRYPSLDADALRERVHERFG